MGEFPSPSRLSLSRGTILEKVPLEREAPDYLRSFIYMTRYMSIYAFYPLHVSKCKLHPMQYCIDMPHQMHRLSDNLTGSITYSCF